MVLFSAELEKVATPFDQVVAIATTDVTNPLTGHSMEEMVCPWDIITKTKEGKAKDISPEFKVPRPTLHACTTTCTPTNCLHLATLQLHLGLHH